jgi:hypothetical protein
MGCKGPEKAGGVGEGRGKRMIFSECSCGGIIYRRQHCLIEDGVKMVTCCQGGDLACDANPPDVTIYSSSEYYNSGRQVTKIN